MRKVNKKLFAIRSKAGSYYNFEHALHGWDAPHAFKGENLHTCKEFAQGLIAEFNEQMASVGLKEECYLVEFNFEL